MKKKDKQNKKDKVEKKYNLRLVDKILIPVFSLIIVGALIYVGTTVLLNSNFLVEKSSKTDDGFLNSELKTPEIEKGKSVNFLIAGIDYMEGTGRGKLTDVVMVANFDVINKKISVLQIPRDTFIGDDYPTGKINAIYGRTDNGGIEGLAKRINKTFNIPIDHYVTINLDGFQSVIKKVGGVTVDIPKKLVLEGVTLNKGKQLLNAETSMKFVRERHSYANQDLGRMEMQKLFMKSLIEKMLALPKTKIVSLVPNVLKDITTDLNIKTVLEYYEDVIKIGNSNINFHMLPVVGGAKNGQVSVLSIKKEETAKLLNEEFRPHSEPVNSKDLGVIELITNYK